MGLRKFAPKKKQKGGKQQQENSRKKKQLGEYEDPPSPYTDGFTYMRMQPLCDYLDGMRAMKNLRNVPKELLENNKFLEETPLPKHIHERRLPPPPKNKVFRQLKEAVNYMSYLDSEDWRQIGEVTQNKAIVENVRRIRQRQRRMKDPNYKEEPEEETRTPSPTLNMENYCEMCQEYVKIDEVSHVPFVIVVMTAEAAKGKWNIDSAKRYLERKLKSKDKRIQACRRHVRDYLRVVRRFETFDVYEVCEYMVNITREKFRQACFRFITWCTYELMEKSPLASDPPGTSSEPVKIAVIDWDMDM